jgi:hypothetical protein
MIGQLCLQAEPLRAGAGIAASPLALEICQSIAAHNADCELGSAA